MHIAVTKNNRRGALASFDRPMSSVNEKIMKKSVPVIYAFAAMTLAIAVMAVSMVAFVTSANLLGWVGNLVTAF